MTALARENSGRSASSWVRRADADRVCRRALKSSTSTSLPSQLRSSRTGTEGSVGEAPGGSSARRMRVAGSFNTSNMPCTAAA